MLPYPGWPGDGRIRMYIEKKRKGVPPQLFTSDGTSNGVVTVADATGFFVKQEVMLSSITQETLNLEIKRFINNTSFKVGPKGSPISSYSDISNLLVADNAFITAPEQDRPGIKPDEYNRAVYAEEPIVAQRVIGVDEFGNYYNKENPLPVDATLSVDTIEVNTDGYDTLEPDSVNITGSEDGSETGQKFGFVNNIRLQILATQNRSQQITYEDFGTKNQRITQIDYTSPIFPGIVARKTITYSLVGNRYRRDSITWSIV